jgi:predicted DNA-binding transcriptional regulator YafY
MNLRLQQMAIDILPWGYPDKFRAFMKDLQSAIHENRLVRMSYINARGESGSRVIEPMTLVLRGYTWYLFAFCLAKNGCRVFRLSRVSELEILEDKFIRRDYSYRDFTSWDMAAEKTVDLTLKISPEARVRAEDYFGDGLTVHENGDILARISYPEDDWLYSMILGFGDSALVLEPLHIRKIIAEKIQKMRALYQT